MTGRDKEVYEYDDYAVDPQKYTPSGKTSEELKAEAEALREKLLSRARKE